MDWPAVIEKFGLAIVGVLAAYGAITSKRTKNRDEAKDAKEREASRRPRPDPKLAPISDRHAEDAEIARLWKAVADLREELRLAKAELMVERHERRSLNPDSRRR